MPRCSCREPLEACANEVGASLCLYRAAAAVSDQADPLRAAADAESHGRRKVDAVRGDLCCGVHGLVEFVLGAPGAEWERR